MRGVGERRERDSDIMRISGGASSGTGGGVRSVRLRGGGGGWRTWSGQRRRCVMDARHVRARASASNRNDEQYEMELELGQYGPPPSPEEVQALSADAPEHVVRAMLTRCRRFARWRDCLHLIYSCENIGVDCVMMTSHVLLESQRLTEAHAVLRLAQSRQIEVRVLQYHHHTSSSTEVFSSLSLISLISFNVRMPP